MAPATPALFYVDQCLDKPLDNIHGGRLQEDRWRKIATTFSNESLRNVACHACHPAGLLTIIARFIACSMRESPMCCPCHHTLEQHAFRDANTPSHTETPHIPSH